MDLHKLAATYVQRLVDGPSTKPRILLLDQETTGIVSLCTTQSALLKNDIFLVDRIENEGRQKMRHLDCICFVRPTNESISYLVEELRNPKYASYSLYFSNIVKKSQLERLGESDDNEAVTKVVEMYCDYYIINKDLFSVNCGNIYGREPGIWNAAALDRITQALTAVLLSCKAKPYIRFESNSGLSQKLAIELSRSIQQQGQLFDFNRDSKTSLLILSRANDPVTPLLSHWTYQAIVDELLGITNNRVNLEKVPDVANELKEIVLSQDQDTFFAEAMYLNFGDLGARIREYVGYYQQKTQSNKNIETVADMKRFVEEFPEFRKLEGNVSKHVTLVGELNRLVEQNQLLTASELEQSLACSDNHSSDLKQVQQLITSDALSPETKYRLIALYALRYETNPSNMTNALLELVERTSGPNPKLHHAVETLIDLYSNSHTRQEDIFGTSSFFSRAQMGLKGLKGVENVYTQHMPLLGQTLESLAKGKLSRQKYPYHDDSPNEHADFVQEVVVFIVGGVTYEEARLVAEFNNQSKGLRVVLGGTSTINSHEFLDVLSSLEWPVSASDRLRQHR